ncbi:MAG: InlB B-repeat-containing protein [Spirochaetales bacterium]|nr:InlB B-repeat-containing protein [Spirochaetales bacterium]
MRPYPKPRLYLFLLPLLLAFFSCEDAFWNADLTSYVEDGVSIITLASYDFSYVDSDSEATVEISLINPQSLSAEYTLNASDTSLVTTSLDCDSATSDNTLYLTVSTDSAAEGESLDFSLDITATDIDRTYDTISFSIPCDTEPNEITDLVVGATTDDAITVAAFTLPSESTDDDLVYMEITYNITGETDSKTVLLEVDEEDYLSIDSEVDFSVTESDYLRYYSPPGAESAELYDFSISLIDDTGQYSDAVTGSNGTTYYYVSFDTEEGSWINDPGSYYVEENSEITLPTSSDISLDDYTLKGWTDDSDYSYNSGGTATITSDTTFTAVWEEETEEEDTEEVEETVYYTVSYEANGGTFTDDYTTSFTVEEGGSFTLPSNSDINYDGYTLLGWSDDDDDSTYTASNTTIEDVYSDLTYTAVWEEDTEEVTYSLNYYDYNGDLYYSDSGYTSSDTVTIDFTSTSTGTGPDGYTFAGWSTDETELDAAATTNYYIADSGSSSDDYLYIGTEDVSLYPVWVAGTPIRTPEEMAAIYDDLTEDYYLTRNIDLTADTTDSTLSYGTSSSFTSNFYGWNHSLTNLSMTASGDYYGLFGVMSGTVEDLSLVEATFDGEDCSYLGFIAGSLSGTVDSCTVDGTITSADSYTGGLVGYVYNDSEDYVTISNSTFDGSITVTNGRAGGIIGYAESANTIYLTISNCSVGENSSGEENTTLTADSITGGIVGYFLTGTVSDCIVKNTTITDTSSSNGFLGGLAGSVSNGTFNDNQVKNLTITGNSTDAVGGLAGAVNKTTISNSGITDGVSFTNINITGSEENTGGLLGYASGTTISNISVSDIEITSPGLKSGGIAGLSGSSTITSVSASNITITDSGNQMGGFIGYATETTLTYCTLDLSGCTLSGDSSSYIGGFIGYYLCDTGTYTISQCAVYGNGTISSSGDYVAGFIASLDGSSSSSASNGTLTLSECYVYAQIQDSDVLGGFIGSTEKAAPAFYLNYCYFRGIIYNYSQTNGLIGADSSYHNNIYFTDCYVMATNSNGEDMGPIEYNSAYETEHDCFYSTEDGEDITDSLGTAMKQEDFTTEANFTTNWSSDYGTYWEWDTDGVINDGYPYLTNLEDTYE